MKTCSRCKQAKPLEAYGPNKRSRDGRLAMCRECDNARQREYNAANRDKQRAKSRKVYWKDPDKSRARSRALREADPERRRAVQRVSERRIYRTTRDSVFAAYGGYVCSCCGENERVFLSIDHINGDGAEHRRKDKGARYDLYEWLRKNGFPAGFRVLCHNCNRGSWLNGGVCPHEQKLRATFGIEVQEYEERKDGGK